MEQFFLGVGALIFFLAGAFGFAKIDKPGNTKFRMQIFIGVEISLCIAAFLGIYLSSIVDTFRHMGLLSVLFGLLLNLPAVFVAPIFQKKSGQEKIKDN